MAIPEAGQALIDTKLKMALDTDSNSRAEHHFAGVCAMLDYAMAVAHLSPGEFSNQRRLVDLQRQRRTYKPLN
jgi:hypothetical protein